MYVTWNLNKKVALVEHHQKSYIVITLYAINDDGEELKYNYSIIYLEYDLRVVFDLEELVRSLQEGNMEALAHKINHQFHL